jgi:hypothetical protein
MALTDAISVACKALGMGADVYFEKDRTKWDQTPNQPETPKKLKPEITPEKFSKAVLFLKGGKTMQELESFYQIDDDMKRKLILALENPA